MLTSWGGGRWVLGSIIPTLCLTSCTALGSPVTAGCHCITPVRARAAVPGCVAAAAGGCSVSCTGGSGSCAVLTPSP